MKSNCRGFTLIEIIISLAVVSVSGILLMAIVLNSTNVALTQSLKVEQGVDINNALSQIKTLVKQSSGVLAYYPSSEAPVYTSSSSQLILNLPSIDSSGGGIPGFFDVFIFYQNGSQLKMQSFPALQSNRKSSDQILSNKIDLVSFKFFDDSNPPLEVSPSIASKIRITISLKQKNGLKLETSIATGESNIRN